MGGCFGVGTFCTGVSGGCRALPGPGAGLGSVGAGVVLFQDGGGGVALLALGILLNLGGGPVGFGGKTSTGVAPVGGFGFGTDERITGFTVGLDPSDCACVLSSCWYFAKAALKPGPSGSLPLTGPMVSRVVKMIDAMMFPSCMLY